MFFRSSWVEENWQFIQNERIFLKFWHNMWNCVMKPNLKSDFYFWFSCALCRVELVIWIIMSSFIYKAVPNCAIYWYYLNMFSKKIMLCALLIELRKYDLIIFWLHKYDLIGLFLAGEKQNKMVLWVSVKILRINVLIDLLDV